jgi:SAM-dependent methyltransferase
MSPALRTARNYYAWIAAQFQPWLGRRVLDVGGGHGAHLEHVVDESRFVMSVDISDECVRDMRARFAGARFEARRGDITDPGLARELASLGFDTVLCINVLEHIERHGAALRAMAEILRPKAGHLFLFVPAHPLLYGTPDELAGHFRRYTRPSLRALLREAGFPAHRAYYFNAAGALAYFVNARLLRPRTLSGPVDAQIKVFDRLFVPVLRRLEGLVPVPFGQSLVAIAGAGGVSR